ncbi:MAG: hypothetical protein HYV09_21640 [Deltaproteobacteria bacterium]|nr:hypothetical protein [Deltaproteobacteria bacterium]
MTLRVVVWDATDVGRFRAGHDGPCHDGPCHDGNGGTADVHFGLSPAWWAGAKLHALARRVAPRWRAAGVAPRWRAEVEGVEYQSRGVRSWGEAARFAVSCARAAQAPLAELQVWGHGGWGFMDLGETRLDRGALARSSELAGDLDALRDVLADGAQVWLRCCSAFGGRAGRAFAPALSARLSTRVVGHTYVIHALQSGTHSLSPGDRTDWPLEEGVVMKDGEPARAKTSGPLQPRTIGCLRLDLPRGW